MIRAMNILLAIAITTGILSGIWGWVAVALGLLSWAGFLGCTAYFACPQGGLKGLLISTCTVMSGVIWAQAIVYGSALAPHLELLGYMITGIVAFLMWHSGASGTALLRARNLYRRLRNLCRRRRLATDCAFSGAGAGFGYAMKNSGLWLAARAEKSKSLAHETPDEA
ncbi:Inner membrane protein ycdZ [Raoultella terrigena]|uniref:Inner membrane protein ycdZ n=1 Tax=Raoultella terrigena TaxID=577 RepID=A0A485B9G7_RAOTE|nr:Inner membrane protein ycdZ [Raoultella terrigena]